MLTQELIREPSELSDGQKQVSTKTSLY